MRASIPLAIFLVVYIVFSFLTMPKEDKSLSAQEIFNTGGFDCDKELRSLEWKNNTGRDIKIRMADLWMGMNVGSVADFNFLVQRDSDRTTLFKGAWDHYADPTGINDQLIQKSFSPNHILLKQDQLLRLWYRCESFDGPTKGHVIVTIWYDD